MYKLIVAVMFILLPPMAMADTRADIFAQVGHSTSVNALAFSSDGRLALSGSADKTFILWDVTSGREIRTLTGHSGWVSSVVFTPDARKALSGSWDGSVRLWDLITGKEILRFEGLGMVTSLALSPDGQQMLTGAIESGLQLWEVTTGRKIRSLSSDSIKAAVFSSDGRQVLSGGYNFLRLRDVATGAIIREFKGDIGDANSVALSPDGKLALSASGGADETVMLWDVATGEKLRSMSGHSGSLGTVVFSPDGRKAMSSGSTDKTVKLWNIDTGTVIHTFVKQAFGVPVVAFSPDGRQALSGSSYNFLKLWDVATGKEIRTLSGHSSFVTSIAQSPGGHQLLSASGNLDRTLKPVMNLWNTDNGRMIRAFSGHTKPVNSVAISPDGTQALSGSDDCSLKLWNVATGKESKSWTAHCSLLGRWKGVGNVAFSPNGRNALSVGLHVDDTSPMLWDVATGKKMITFNGHSKSLSSATFSQDGQKILSGSLDNTLKLWDALTGKEIRTFSGHTNMVLSVALSPDGRQALSGSWDQTLKLWDIASGAQIVTLTGHLGPVTSVAFSPEGRVALSGSNDGTVKLWNLLTGKELKTLSGHARDVTAVTFSTDGTQVLSGSADSTIRIWDAATGETILQLISFEDGEWLSITPEGYFSASSAKAAENLNIRMGMNVYGIDQFYDVFYRPDIVEAALAGKDTSSMVTLTINDAIKNPPPVIEQVEAPASSAADTVKVAYRIKSDGGGIGEVRVFHNGKLVKSDGVAHKLPDGFLGKKANQLTSEVLVSQMRGLSVAAAKNDALRGAVTSPPKPDLYESVVEIEPVPGENDISVVAFNAQNSIQSTAYTASFISSKAPVAPRLHILAVGINEYKDKSASLAFAVKDSRDIAARWKAQAANIYGEQNIFVETISNAQASREGILARINQIAARVKPTDHFVLFVASHGVLLGEQYYMVTSDYDGALQPSKLISANEIVDFSKRIKALSQLYILDTCHAGGMGGVVSGLYDARVSVLAKKMGLHMFASASSAEEAIDGFEGNGLFTHTLLAGLNNNKQADSNSDKQVSLMELGSYSKAQTRDIAKKLNHKQDPLTINFGQDNPVYRLH